MARVLLGWELGANRGHISRLYPIADALAEEGHEVALALQNLAFVPADRLASFPLYQAPLWPRLLTNFISPGGALAISMGDILVRVGLDEPATLPGLITAWQQIIADFRADVVAGDFSPALSLAARGRVPSIALGTGFSLPPAEMEFFPALIEAETAYREGETLARVNAALAGMGEPTIASLPGLFAADHALVGEISLLDPYADFRIRPLSSPAVAATIPANPGARGDEIFVYAFARMMADAPLWDGLKASGLPVRAYVPDAGAAFREGLASRGIIVETAPLGFDEIAACSRFVLSHGGHGFVCSALLSGLPQVVVHYDLEKRMTGFALAKHQLGGHIALNGIKPEAFARSLRQYHAAAAPHEKVQQAAAGFAAYKGQSCPAEVLAIVETS
ncbi:glycosyl transferase-like UDP-glucuronosyltransferase [Blastomonas sp.]|uniref:glycosyl transferase-like UDP-glucuronosyltransferase n=1 Tax=Blastomonas sp. TaxID=1909299 RepID=UPI003593926F